MRTDPMFYELEIEEIKTGQIARGHVGCWWTADHSAAACRRMCDCQLAGYFHAKPSKYFDPVDKVQKDSWSNAFGSAQYEYLRAHKCSHQPSRKFRALSATLPGGDKIDIAA